MAETDLPTRARPDASLEGVRRISRHAGVRGDTRAVHGSGRAAVAGSDELERWVPAGDGLPLDLDLGAGDRPAGTRLGLGCAVGEVAEQPRRGCLEVRVRCGKAALAWVNAPDDLGLRSRGRTARVVVEVDVRAGDVVHVVRPRTP